MAETFDAKRERMWQSVAITTFWIGMTGGIALTTIFALGVALAVK